MNLQLQARRFVFGLAFVLGAWALAPVPAAQATILNSAGASISLSGTGEQGSFLDTYFFNLGQTFGLSESVNYSNRIGVGMVSNFSANLFTASGSVPLLSGFDSAPGTNITNNQFYAASLAAGAYRLEISGLGSGFLGGGYTGSLTAVPAFAPLLAVPEPESWAMMFAGLVLMLIQVRQVSTKSAVPAISTIRG